MKSDTADPLYFPVLIIEQERGISFRGKILISSMELFYILSVKDLECLIGDFREISTAVLGHGFDFTVSFSEQGMPVFVSEVEYRSLLFVVLGAVQHFLWHVQEDPKWKDLTRGTITVAITEGYEGIQAFQKRFMQ